MAAATFGDRLRAQVANLDPSDFAFVMATAIVATGAKAFGLFWISIPLLPLAAAGYVILFAATTWRLIAYPERVLADASQETRAFGFFTFVAAGNVLAIALSGAGLQVPALVLIGISAAAWVLLTYGLVARLAVVPGKPGLAAASGGWLLWAVGTQSVATAATDIASHDPSVAGDFVFIATGMWSIAVILYLVLIAIIVSRLLLVDLPPGQLSNPYWITMGATAITVLASAQILGLRHVHLPIPSPVESGITFMFWAFGSWWIPLLLALGVWRYLLARVRLTYQSSLWAIVFPLGMYATASASFGVVENIGALVVIARVGIWVAAAAWILTFAGMLGASTRLFRGSSA
jgi:tellurite resistance protein TehA-like permease